MFVRQHASVCLIRISEWPVNQSKEAFRLQQQLTRVKSIGQLKLSLGPIWTSSHLHLVVHQVTRFHVQFIIVAGMAETCVKLFKGHFLGHKHVLTSIACIFMSQLALWLHSSSHKKMRRKTSTLLLSILITAEVKKQKETRTKISFLISVSFSFKLSTWYSHYRHFMIETIFASRS